MPISELNIPPKPDKYSSLWLGQLVDCVPEGCVWILRNNFTPDEDPYFCHIHDRDCEFYQGKAVSGISCKATAVSPEEAMRNALRAYEREINK
jgi:hypothetical protein